MTAYNFFALFVTVMALLALIFAIIGTVAKKRGKLKSRVIIKTAEIVSAIFCDLSGFCLVFFGKDSLAWLSCLGYSHCDRYPGLEENQIQPKKCLTTKKGASL